MVVISRNNLMTPVEMVGADKINKKTRSVFTHQNIIVIKLGGGMRIKI